MRLLAASLIVCLMTCPAWAAFKGPSAIQQEFVTAVTASEAPEGTTCVLTGHIIEHITRDRYTFKDATGSIIVNIPPHVFGAMEVTPEDTVRLTGEIRGKRDARQDDDHLGVRYLEVIK